MICLLLVVGAVTSVLVKASDANHLNLKGETKTKCPFVNVSFAEEVGEVLDIHVGQSAELFHLRGSVMLLSCYGLDCAEILYSHSLVAGSLKKLLLKTNTKTILNLAFKL